MPASPYQIYGVVDDTDNSTPLESVNMVAYNVTTGEELTTTTDSNGEYLFDLANLTSSYSSGDVIFISAYIANKSVDYRTTASAGDDTGGTEEKNLYMMWGNTHALNDTRFLAGLITNTSGSVGNIKFYDRENDVEVLEVQVVANSSQDFDYNKPKLVQGLCVVPSANTMKASIQADV